MRIRLNTDIPIERKDFKPVLVIESVPNVQSHSELTTTEPDV